MRDNRTCSLGGGRRPARKRASSDPTVPEGDQPPELPNLLKQRSAEKDAWGSSGRDARFLSKLRRLLGKSSDEDRKLILHMAQKMASR